MAELNNVEQEARQLGWVPEEEFRGEKGRWIDADTFVDRGRHIMPILQKNNEKLQSQLREESSKREKLEESLRASQESIAALEEHYTAANKRQVAEARASLVAELKAAREVGDTAAEVQILDELTQHSAAAVKPTEKPVEKKLESKAPEELPEVTAFKANNAWYGQDLKKTVAFNRIAEDLRIEGEAAVGQAFIDKVIRKYEESTRTTTTKVEGGGGRGGGGSTKGGSRFGDLPSEAKQACHDDNKRLVGPDRRYKTVAEWEKKYAEIYFGEEA